MDNSEIFDEESVAAAERTVILLPDNVVASILQKLDEIKTELQEVKNTQGAANERLTKIENSVFSLSQSVSGTSGGSLSSGSGSSPTPFVSVNDEIVKGNKHNLFIPTPILNKLLVAGKVREAVRLLLLVFHDIKALRKMTLTGMTIGKSKSKKMKKNDADLQENQNADSLIQTQLPAHQIQLITAAVLKLFKVPTNRLNNPELVKEWNATKTKEVRTGITNVLEYFKSEYDEEGVRIKKTKNGSGAPEADDDAEINIDQ